MTPCMQSDRATRSGEPEYSCSLPAELARVSGVCQAASQFLNKNGQGSLAFAVGLLLREFLNNAIIHGNRLDGSKRVGLAMRLCRTRLVIRIADEGPGFNWRTTIQRGVPDGDAVSGRGLPIGVQYTQRVRYNRAGNQVVLWVARELKEEAQMSDFSIARTGTTARITLQAQLTAVEAPSLQAALKQEIAGGVKEIEFDLANTTSLDSTAIGLLIAASNSLVALQGSVRLSQVSSPLMKLLQGMRLVERLHASAKEGG